MSFREMFVRACTLYFALVTLITVAIMATGLVLDPAGRFGYEALSSPLVFAAAGALPTVVMYSRHELTVREVIVRKVIQLALIEALVLSIAFASPTIPVNSATAVAVLVVAIAVVFLLANAFTWLVDSASARKLTSQLQELQEIHARDDA